MSDPRRTPVILTCSVLRREVDAIVRRRHWEVPIEMMDSVLHLEPERLSTTLAGRIAGLRAAGHGVVLVYGDCCGAMHDLEGLPGVTRLPGHNCVPLLLGDAVYRELRRDGAFFVLPEWALRWREMFVDRLGLGEGQARELLTDQHRRLVYLDTGLVPVPGPELAAFAAFARLPLETRSIGLGVLEQSLEEALRQHGVQTTAVVPGAGLPDPAMAAMVLEMTKDLLTEAAAPVRFAERLTTALRDLTGARCVALMRTVLPGEIQVVAVDPPRRAAAITADAPVLVDALRHAVRARSWDTADPALDGTITQALKRLEFGLSVGVPLVAAGVRVGSILVLDLPDRLRHEDLLATLDHIAGVTALVVRNAFLFEEQERLVDERTRQVIENEERYRALFAHATDAIFLTDAGRIVDCNAAGCALLGGDRQQVIGRNPMDFTPARQPDGSDSQEAILGLWNSAAQGEPTRRAFWRLHRFDGTPVDTEVSVNCVSIAGRLLMMANMRDISQRLRLEQQLFHAAKEDSIGRLAGGVAHDFNNILAAIAGYAELLSNQTPADAPQMVRIRRIIDAARRGTALTQQLLAFARRQVIEPRRVDLSRVVEQACGMLPMLLGEHIELRFDLAADLPEVLVDPNQIEQIVMNLTANARDAMPDGGTILLSTRCTDLTAEDLADSPGLRPGSYVALSIADDGEGIPPAVIERIFEPFFTTKSVGKGTGLGLAMCHGIVRQNRGHITVSSAQGRGTTFRIYLPPAAAGATGAPAPVPDDDSIEGGHETVLLVEDDHHVRAMAEEYLGILGYQVLVAVDGVEAMALAKANAGDLDAVITDVMMPRMGGRELVRRLTADYPHIRALFISGYGEDAVTDHGAVLPGIAFLPKPFTLAALATAMRRLLETDLPEGKHPFDE